MQNLGGDLVIFLESQNCNFRKIRGLKLLLSQKKNEKRNKTLRIIISSLPYLIIYALCTYPLYLSFTLYVSECDAMTHLTKIPFPENMIMQLST